MALSSEVAADVLAGTEPAISQTLGRLLALDEQIDVLGEASSLAVTLRAMTIGEAIDTLKRMVPFVAAPAPLKAMRAPDGKALSTLSDRELEVVRLVAEGLSNKEISSRLKLSDKTVKNHISHILAKMNLTARTQVAVYAIRAGLV
jgi:DNA-binding CsgD family transcriptional regulator